MKKFTALALSLIFVFALPVTAQSPYDCDNYPIAFLQHSQGEPSSDNQFWSIMQNCQTTGIKKFNLTVLLLDFDGDPITTLADYTVTIQPQTANEEVVNFDCPATTGTYQVVGIVSNVNKTVVLRTRVEALTVAY